MSAENVERMRHMADAYNARDIETLLTYCDPGIEFESGLAVGAAVYRGHEGMRRWREDHEDAFRDTRTEPEAIFDLGEHTLAFHRLRGRGKHSGVEVEMANAMVARWRNGRIVHLKGYVHREDALHDLGVTEDELEPSEP